MITGFFLVHEKEVRNTNAGKPYLRMELGDRSGTIEARMWDQFDALAKGVNRDDFVKVQARVEIYRNKPQLSFQQFRLAKPEEIDLGDFLAHTSFNVEDMYKQLLAYAEEMKNPWLKKLVTKILSDPQLAARFKRAPAAKVMHHAYLGGLLEHVVGLCGSRQAGCCPLPRTGCGSVCSPPRCSTTSESSTNFATSARSLHAPKDSCLGHIVMELETVTKAMDEIEGFPAKLKTVVQHILISHHGQYEFGSPKLPMIREALVFHYMDDMDSKMAAVRAALAIDSGEEEWSAYSGALGRKFLRLEKYLAEAPVEAAEEG